MFNGSRACILALITALVGAGCGDDNEDGKPKVEQQARHGLTAEQASEVLAKVGDRTITLGDFADEMARQSPYLRGRFQSYEKRKEYLDNMVRFELLAQEAERKGYLKHPAVLREKKRLLEEQLVNEEVDAKLAASPITDDEVRAYFEAHQSEYQKPAQRRISHIVVNSEAAAKKIIAKLGASPADDEFKRLATTQSVDKETGSRFGDTGFHTHPSDRTEGETSSLPDAVIEAAFELESLGDVSGKPIKSEQGFHVVRLTAKRDAFKRTFEHAAPPIRAQLEKERRDATLKELEERLRKDAKIEIHEDALTKLIAEYAPRGSQTPSAGSDARDGETP